MFPPPPRTTPTAASFPQPPRALTSIHPLLLHHLVTSKTLNVVLLTLLILSDLISTTLKALPSHVTITSPLFKLFYNKESSRYSSFIHGGRVSKFQSFTGKSSQSIYMPSKIACINLNIVTNDDQLVFKKVKATFHRTQ